MEFQSWKVNFRTEVCLRTADPQMTMLWITEVEIAKSIDKLTSRSTTGPLNFPDFDMLDAMIAKANCVKIYEYSRATGAHEAVQGLSTLFATSLQNDDDQDFDVSGIFDHAGGTHSHVGVMDYPRIPFWEWNLRKFPGSVKFHSWKLNFRTEVLYANG